MFYKASGLKLKNEFSTKTIIAFCYSFFSCGIASGSRSKLIDVIPHFLCSTTHSQTKVTERRNLDLKSLKGDWRIPGSNHRPLFDKASGL